MNVAAVVIVTMTGNAPVDLPRDLLARGARGVRETSGAASMRPDVRIGREYGLVLIDAQPQAPGLSAIGTATLIEAITGIDARRATSGAIVGLFEVLDVMLGQDRYEEIDAALRTIHVNRVAPELLLGALRYTSHWSASLPSWYGLLRDARLSLSGRGLDADQLLEGLEHDA